MSITVVAGPTLNLNVVDGTQVVDLAIQTPPTLSLQFAIGQGPAGVGLPSGGFTDNVLAKASNTTGDVVWKTIDASVVGLSNVNNTSDMDKPVSTAQQTAIDGAKAYADGLVVGLWDDRGVFDASVNTYPTSGGSGPAGAIKKGDVWTISVVATSGPLLDYPLGTTVRAIVDTPAQVGANWAATSSGLVGIVPVLQGGTGVDTLTGLAKGNGTSAFTAAVAGTDYVDVGAVTSNGITMSTGKILGRTTASTGAIEEISIGSGLTLSGGSLSASVSSTLTVQNKTGAYAIVAGDNGAVLRMVSGSADFTLPSCATVGLGFNVYLINTQTSANVAVTRVGTDTFQDGSINHTLERGGAIRLVCTDASASGKWQIVQVGASGLGNLSVAIGSSANASGTSSTALGAGAYTDSTNSVAIGANTAAYANYSTAIGNNSSGTYSQTVTGAGATALGGSYASGQDSFAAAIADNTSTYGAQGNNSVAVGKQNKATNTSASALGGYFNSATGSHSTVIGGFSGVASGQGSVSIPATGNGGNTASGQNSVAIGEGANAALFGKYAYASGLFSTSIAQLGAMVLRRQTTDATATVLTSDNGAGTAANQVILPNDSAYTFTGSLIARNTATDTDCKAWTFFGAIRRGVAAANTALIGTPAINVVGSDGSAWTFTLTADTTNGGLAVTVTGEAAKTIRWVCRIDTVEVTG